MFIRNAWYVAASADEVADGLLARTLLDESIVIYRDKAGCAHALEDRCRHRGAPLSLGWKSERGLVCGYHGVEFDHTGACIKVPGGRARISPYIKVRSYPLVEKGAILWIWMGDPDLADPQLILNHPIGDAEQWPQQHDMLHIKASCLMVLENLMDLSHLSYLHKDSIGSSEQDSAGASMNVQATSTGVKFLRLMRNAKAPQYWRERYGDDTVDRWSEFEFIAPSCIRQYSGSIQAGTYDQGNRTGRRVVRNLHAVTPETERSCHYFFYAADGSDNGGAEGFQLAIAEVFKEDAVMLEQQQIRLEKFDRSLLVDIPSDVARVQMNRYLKSRFEAERLLEEKCARPQDTGIEQATS